MDPAKELLARVEDQFTFPAPQRVKNLLFDIAAHLRGQIEAPDRRRERNEFAMAALPWCLAQNYGNDWGKDGIRHIPAAASKALDIATALQAEADRRDHE